MTDRHANVYLPLLLVFGLSSLGGCTSAPKIQAPDAADGGVIEDAATQKPDDSTGDAGPKEAHQKRHSLAVSGWGQHALHSFTMNDKQGREILRLEKASGRTDVNALKRGAFHVTTGSIEGVELTLYRDETGHLSLVNAVKEQPPTVRHGLMVPPTEKHEQQPWLMEVGPIAVEDATLTIAFTKKPVVFHVDSAKVTVRRRAQDAGPVIYIQEVQGQMIEPKPFRKPVRIAWANGLVNLVGKPLVHLAARTCIRKSPLRIDAVVEARKEPVHLEGDSAGIGGALGRLGINLASHLKKGKLTYQHEAVHINGGPGCDDAEVPPRPPQPEQAPHDSQPKQ